MTVPRAEILPAPAGLLQPGATVSLLSGRCINVRGRIEACDLCVRACHAAAITVNISDLVVDAALCVGCGACVPACPAGALEMPGFAPAAVPAAAVRADRAELACAAAGRAGLASVPCHKMTDARLLAAMFAAGAREIVLVGTEGCAECPAGDARPALAEAGRTLEKWFGDAVPRLVLERTKPRRATAAPDAAGRRHLLRGSFHAFVATPETKIDAPLPDFDDAPGEDDDDETGSPRPVPYQALLAAARAQLPFRADGPSGATARTIGAACSGCMVCAELCPTGALVDATLARRDGIQRQISFDPALCTNCTLCQKVCPMEVIVARALRGTEAATAARAVLFARAEQRCGTCGGLFAAPPGAEALCPGCENDREMDQDWMEMLGG